jgi:DNA-binding FadR family transcriptional regulator
MTPDPTDTTPATGRRTAEAIAETLIDEIRRGVLALDAPLPTERDLCDRFTASRPTVREALALMQMRGYLEGGSGKRPRAARPSLVDVLSAVGDDIRDILGDAESTAHLEQMRHFIETGAAREAALRADHVQILRLRAALDANFAAIGTAAFGATDIAFHRALVSVIGNPVILTLHDMFVSAMLARRAPVADPLGHNRMVYDEHRAIFQAVLDRDVATATEVMDRHMARSYRARLAPPIFADADPTAADKG